MAEKVTTIGRDMIEHILPKDMRGEYGVFDKKTVTRLLKDLARRHPDEYRRVSHELAKLGAQIAYREGSGSFGLRHILTAQSARRIREELKRKIRELDRDDSLTPEERHRKISETVASYIPKQSDAILQESIAEGNPLADLLLSGARGNTQNLAGMRGSDMLYLDHKDRRIPMPIMHSFSEGLTPAEYWAGAYGARKGVLDTKLATQRAGYLAKQLAQAAHRAVVIAPDRDKPPSTLRGLPVDTDDSDNEGSLLASPAGPYGRNTVLTPKILEDLKKRGIKKILVRSTAVDGDSSGGVYARDAGVREFGNLPSVGEIIGMVAAQALSEPLSQAQLCLVAGTLVRMADNSVKKIEDIQVGDWVKGFNSKNEIVPVRVSAVYDNGTRLCTRTMFSSLDLHTLIAMVSTPDHKLMAADDSSEKNEYTFELRPVRDANFVLRCQSDGGLEYFRRYSCEDAGEWRTFDLEVDIDTHLFVLANGLVVSNSSKHGGGVVGGQGADAVSGFDQINNTLQSPRIMPGAGTHAREDGVVSKIDKAPAGGYYVYVGAEKHYVPQNIELSVKLGDRVEAGDMLSKGLPHPGMLVAHKGIGEGRKYFVEALRQAFMAAGLPNHRRNIELITRPLINHVRLTEEVGDYLPDELVSYNELEGSWKPREGYKTVPTSQAKGLYLERPYLHYSIGTKIRPSVVKTLQQFGVSNVDAHDSPPPFEAEYIRAAATLQNDPDWLVRQYGAGLKRPFLRAVHHGETSDPTGTSFVPSLVEGVNFGHVGQIKTPTRAKQAFLLEMPKG